jgi:hypothetical protein
MSHIVQIQTQIRDPVAITSACRRLSLPEPVHGECQLYSGSRTGWQVRLPGWRYPVVADIESGEVFYDHFEGRWGAEPDLHRFLQAYAVEKTLLEAHRRGHSAIERPLEDGSIQIHITLGVSV